MNFLDSFDDEYIVNPNALGRRDRPCYKLDTAYNFRCVVCKKWTYDVPASNDNRLIAHAHTVKIGAIYYVMPKFPSHANCLGQLELNPLVYEPELLYVPI